MAVLTHDQLVTLWELAGGPPWAADTAAAIALAESGGRTDAISNTAYPKLPGYHPPGPGASPEYSVGLWQVNRLAHPQYSTASLETQMGAARAAVQISGDGSNFSPWSTYTSGAYKDHLQAGGEPQTQPGTTAPPSTATIASHTHRGYADLKNSLGRHLPRQLERSRRQRAATLRLLGARHRVGG